MADEFENALVEATELEPKDEAIGRVQKLQDNLGNLKTQDLDLLMGVFLTYRKLSAWREMVDLYENFPAELKDAAMAI